MGVLGLLVGYHCLTYLLDVVVRPAEVARVAKARARRRGKPVLNVGCGTPGSSFRYAVLGPTTSWGDVNCDVAAREACNLQTRVCHCDAHRLPFHAKEFGAAIASHVLEHVEDPVAALRELERVADEVYVITPAWWSTTTWLHPGHRWYRDGRGRWHSLWRQP